jgi:hypothetical protein
MANITKIRLSGTTYTIVDESAIHSLDGYWNSGQTENAITAATSALAESIAEQGYQNASQVSDAITAVTNPINSTLTAHTANTDIHVTTADKTAWNAKADLSDIPSVSGYADAVKYDSNAKEMKFYHGGTSGTEVFSFDASPFLVDGMIESVVITSITSGGSEVQVLEITWNSAAGGQVTDIPLTAIFDPSNYYTTAQTQAYVTAYTYDKSTIDQKISESGTFDPTQYYTTANTYSKTEVDTALSGKADTATTYTKTEVDTALSGKQATLVSGTNIKTVGTNSLLGSGNIALMTASIGTGNDSETLIFDFA